MWKFVNISLNYSRYIIMLLDKKSNMGQTCNCHFPPTVINETTGVLDEVILSIFLRFIRVPLYFSKITWSEHNLVHLKRLERNQIIQILLFSSDVPNNSQTMPITNLLTKFTYALSIKKSVRFHRFSYVLIRQVHSWYVSHRF